jgi:putative membrane protein
LEKKKKCGISTIMYGLFTQILASLAGLFAASKFIRGFSFTGDIIELLIAGAILGSLNFFLKPILKVILLPFRILTLGLFTFIINIAILWGVDRYLETLTIDGIIPLFWGTLLISALSIILGWFFKPKKVNSN